MSRNGKVIVAMSGGVDSSVAACLLQERGYECVGVFMRVGDPHLEPDEASPVGTNAQPRRLKHGCCAASDALDACTVAGKLDIPFYALDFERDFDRIIEYFVDEYSRARTPNPCVMCNMELKFGKLLRYADMMDAEFVATGHYARILRQEGQTHLARSLNRAKDQSYVLFGIRRDDLPRCLFPLGEIGDKGEVRRMAAKLGLRVHDKPESQEICFVQNNDYKQVVRARRPETLRPGEVHDSAGNLLGTHEGVASYTIGQRRGLGIATGSPIYVTRLDVEANIVTVGPREELLSGGLVADQVNWLTDPPPVGESRPAEIKIRYMHTPAPGEIRVFDNGDVECRFNDPQPAVTPGQVAVFYDDEAMVLGGGWIAGSIANSE
jgi:tRNA-specific 2-thiouridylase